MKPMYKTTGCFRFFIFLIVFVPMVFFGAAYFRGENGMKILKDYYHQIIGKSDAKPTSQDTFDPNTRIRELEKELKAAQDKIRELEEELKAKEGR